MLCKKVSQTARQQSLLVASLSLTVCTAVLVCLSELLILGFVKTPRTHTDRSVASDSSSVVVEDK